MRRFYLGGANVVVIYNFFSLNALLWKSYGISLNEAQNIVSKYKAGNIEITDDNRDTMRVIFKSL